MKLNDAELTLISEALDMYSWKRLKPTKIDDIIALSKRVEIQREKHNWKVDGKPGMFDDNYKCSKCGITASESVDSSYTKPEFGCKGKS